MIQSTKIGMTDTVIYTATSAVAITLMLITNTGTDNDSVTLNAVTNGDAARDENTILKNLPLVKDDTYAFNVEKFILNSGDSIHAISKTGTSCVTVSGMSLA